MLAADIVLAKEKEASLTRSAMSGHCIGNHRGNPATCPNRCKPFRTQSPALKHPGVVIVLMALLVSF
jgi:hypothetical protein